MAKSRLALLAGATAVFVVVGASVTVDGTRGMSVGVSLVSLGDVWAHTLGCDSAGVWLGVTRRATVEEVKSVGVEVALGSQPFSVVRVERTGESRTLFDARGRPLALSVGEDGAMWLLFQDPPESPRDTYSVRMSTDGGVSWSSVVAPRDAIGLGFRSRKVGYCWSASRLYRTDDGGQGWRAIDVGRGRLAGKMEPARPTMGPDGALWVPLHPEAAEPGSTPAGGSKLIRIDGSSEATRVYTLPGEIIAGVAPDPSGDVHLALAPSMGPGCRIVRIASATTGGGAKALWSQPKGSCRLQFATGLLLLDYIESFEPKTFFSVWPHRALASTDAGRTWVTRDLTRARVSSLCPTTSGFWAVSQTEKFLRFHPLPDL